MRHVIRLVSLAVLALSSAAASAGTAPTKDIPGSSDPAWLKRYEGSVIIAQQRMGFDAVALPGSKLLKQDGCVDRDDNNNCLFIPKRWIKAEGTTTRTLYLAPEDRSPIEVIRGYIDEIKSHGGKLLYGCQDDTCGGDIRRGNDGGGGDQSLMMVLYPERKAKVESFSAGDCADDDVNEQRYIVATMPGDNGDRTLAVMAYGIDDDYPDCKPIYGRTGALVIAVDPRPREKKMVTVTSDEMRKALEDEGRISLYGIYFDTNKSVVKPESKATLEQIANLMKQLPKLKLGVVGHTDDVGNDDANLKLSRRRADAVVTALVEDYGIDEARLEADGAGEGKPVADNKTEGGRAKNRRVELVKR